MQIEKDPVTGTDTTGHEWDGLQELDTPVPKAFKIALLISIAIAAAMWVMLPSWPYYADGKWAATEGTSGYTDQAYVEQRLLALSQKQAKFDQRFTKADLGVLAKDPKAREAYFAAAATLYRENCAMCHGRSATGQLGFPNLVDSQWLWDGKVDGVYNTIKFGINSDHDDTLSAEMPAFGKDEILNADQITDVVEYVLSISKQDHLPASAKRGALIFNEECVACHSDGGVGGAGAGAPNMTDDYWIYGGTRDAIKKTVVAGSIGVMPHWVTRLRDAEIRQLALYLTWLGSSPESSPESSQGSSKALKK